MRELLEKTASAMIAFGKDAPAQAGSGNKATGERAHKASSEIERCLKTFRKVAVEASMQ